MLFIAVGIWAHSGVVVRDDNSLLGEEVQVTGKSGTGERS
jgi:hypothetical protein